MAQRMIPPTERLETVANYIPGADSPEPELRKERKQERKRETTPRERAEDLRKDKVILSIGEIEQAITAAVEEVEDRVANERDSYIERVAELEKENAILRARFEFLSPSVKAGLND